MGSKFCINISTNGHLCLVKYENIDKVIKELLYWRSFEFEIGLGKYSNIFEYIRIWTKKYSNIFEYIFEYA